MTDTKKALIILNDSDPVLSRVCKNKFKKQAGWETLLSSNYNEAIEIIKKEKPAFLITDIILTDSSKDGLDLLRMVRESDDPTISKMPVLIFTDLGQEQDKKRAFDLGATDYLVKTELRIKDVIERIEKLIS